MTSNPRTAKDWQNWENSLKVRQSSANAFAGLKEYIAAGDPEIAPGIYLSDCRQIDGRTGDYARTIYGGYGHCFNNPHFRKAYFDYLAKVYAAGVDGIMIGRATFGNPWIFADTAKALAGEEGYERPILAKRVDVAVRQFELALEDKGEHIACLEARKHFAWYLRGVAYANYYKEQISSIQKMEDIYRIADGIRRDLQ